MRISDWSSDVCSTDLTSWTGNLSQHEQDNVRIDSHAVRRHVEGRQFLLAIGRELQAQSRRADLCTCIARVQVRQLPDGSCIDYCAICAGQPGISDGRSEEHTSELQSLMRISYAVFCL